MIISLYLYMYISLQSPTPTEHMKDDITSYISLKQEFMYGYVVWLISEAVYNSFTTEASTSVW